MTKLVGAPLAVLLECILSEYKNHKSIFGYKESRFFKGFTDIDVSVDIEGARVATPMGPAAGPHTQLAQNIVTAYLCGSRIIELKTVQVLDQPDIPRPCIDMRNVGYNVEWSQELSLDESYAEYIKAWILLRCIEESAIFPYPPGDAFYKPIFDISVGYDYKGITSASVDKWLKNMLDASHAVHQFQDQLPTKYEKYKNLKIAPKISSSITLSTFHGCPVDEIEAIVTHLMETYHVDVVIKMNPTLLGYDAVRDILQKKLGYTDIDLDKKAFDSDLGLDQVVSLLQRVNKSAKKIGCKVGAKFTNTLVVKNKDTFFTDKVRYLSGTPLHVLSIEALKKVRQRMISEELMYSFSGGVDKDNFSDTIACGLKPVTMCSDLLKKGGYGRQLDYLNNLRQDMQKLGATTVEEFIEAKASLRPPSQGAASLTNTMHYADTLIKHEKYQQKSNAQMPRSLDSQLELFDCLSCNLCIPMCPNLANAELKLGKMDIPITNFEFNAGEVREISAPPLKLTTIRQIYNLADFCNECGHCGLQCPEQGEPFVAKPRIFFSKTAFKDDQRDQAFYFAKETCLEAKIGGKKYQLESHPKNMTYTFASEEAVLELDEKFNLTSYKLNAQREFTVDMKNFHTLRLLLEGFMANKDYYGAILAWSSPSKD